MGIVYDEKLKKILLKNKYITKDVLEQAEKDSKKAHISIIEHLLYNNLLNRITLGEAVAEKFGLKFFNLNTIQPPRELILKLPEKLAKKYKAVIVSETDDSIVIAVNAPIQKELVNYLKKTFPKKKLDVVYSFIEDIESCFVHYQKPLETRFSKIIKQQKRVAPEILDEIFEDAISFKASDIHFEPQGDDIIIRFRIDGVLHEVGRLAREHYENILNRVKVKSRLRFDEHYTAQDGSMYFEKEGNVYDLRTSIVPTIEGEKIVFRILSSYVQGFTLGDLGLTKEQQEILQNAARKPFGMILVTGPTGSGKTTTLYAVLRLLNKPEVNITTIEDPVEYKITGVNQIQVNPQTNLTFATGLRSIVRQDPDIILVGEIRDVETAEIAVNAALTGHLLLSTFHATDASTAIPRLLYMSIEPFLLASTLEIIIAQRLIRKICEKCKYSFSITISQLKKDYSKIDKFLKVKGRKITLYKGKGCSSCGFTGYSGRTAIFEFIRNTKSLQELILKNPSSREIYVLARKEGTKSFFEDGIEKVKKGITTLDELYRVASPPEY